jgi:predicted amidohydrolase
MWSAGFAYRKLPELAAQTPRVLDAVAALSAELGLTVVGSLPELVDGQVCNTSFVTDRGMLAGSYRKLHLFSLMNEHENIAAGDRSVVVATSVGKLGLAVCYDLRFPELFRKLALDGAEIICLPGEWPAPRQLHWRTLLRARAIENQCFVAAANCCGRQGKLDFFGMSLLIAPRGELLAEADDFATELVATFDFQELTDYRAQITCFADRRPDVYGTLP